MQFKLSISNELAARAFSGVSQDPEGRGSRCISDYETQLESDFKKLQILPKNTEEEALLFEEFAKYKDRFEDKLRAYLYSNSRCISSFITGPANFPVRRAEKYRQWSDNKYQAFVDFRKRAMAAIAKKIRPETLAIMAGDDNAVSRLQTKINNLESFQTLMKNANAAIRKCAKAGKEVQVQELLKLNISEGNARKMLEPDFCGRIGFADYELKNNNANIRRLKQRLEQISANKAAEVRTVEAEGVRYEDNPGDNRVRLFFDGKPAEEIRADLKSNGFRWSPMIGAWQAYRNYRSDAAAKRIAKIA